MPRITPAAVDGNEYERVMGQRLDIREQWFGLDAHMRFSGLLSPELKEEVRRSLAPGVGCVFCESLGAAKPEQADRREALAVAYADLLRDPKQIDDATVEVLREEFSEAEIVELTCWALFMIAAQGFGAAMRIAPASAQDLATYTEWRRDGEAAAARAA